MMKILKYFYCIIITINKEEIYFYVHTLLQLCSLYSDNYL